MVTPVKCVVQPLASRWHTSSHSQQVLPMRLISRYSVSPVTCEAGEGGQIPRLKPWNGAEVSGRRTAAPISGHGVGVKAWCQHEHTCATILPAWPGTGRGRPGAGARGDRKKPGDG